jgi:ABC-type branched-subunit amino acid transport system substrate-binding protein
VGGQQFEKAFAAKYGTAPDTSHSSAYIVVGTAIAAIRLAASTDREVLAKAMRSGNVVWDAPGGSLTIRPNGENSVLLQVMQIQNGKVVPYWK